MEEIFHDSQIFDAALINLYQILIWVRERVSKYFSQKDLEKIELATEEAVVNIIKHAYKKKKGKIEIEISVDETLHLIFKDKGPKFNPLSVRKKVDFTKDIKKRKEGGLGIFFIFQCMDEVKYQRKDSFNLLIMKKKRNKLY
ncbi:MAG: Serine-protein kinase RsbW [Candidatus Anoxychlamydiales bacterium]|nr:Serine-protein kinase RsbW [Candidatus Anoxychlamydiales bacterium]NGX40373.1 Serine-protein kinase RsbW [Candidatus Anoxychlamydiales bacterium]HEU64644.1 ATP-binding protein [Chlamydiota bacterium]